MHVSLGAGKTNLPDEHRAVRRRRAGVPLQHVSTPGVVAQITLTGSAIDGARRFLDDAGLNEYTIYADLDALCRELHRKNGLSL